MQYLSCVHPRVCMCNYQNPGLDVITALHVLDRTASGEKIRTGTVARCPMCACVQFLFKSELLGRLPVTSKAGQNQATRSSLSLTHTHTRTHTDSYLCLWCSWRFLLCLPKPENEDKKPWTDRIHGKHFRLQVICTHSSYLCSCECKTDRLIILDFFFSNKFLYVVVVVRNRKIQLLVGLMLETLLNGDFVMC